MILIDNPTTTTFDRQWMLRAKIFKRAGDTHAAYAAVGTMDDE
jgi:hypothetical protein